MPIQKQKIILIGGIVLGLAAVFMTKMYIDQQRQAVEVQAKRALANIQANQTTVLVAKNDIPKGTQINASLLEQQIIPNKYAQPNAATSLDRVEGMITIATISKGQQITRDVLSQSRQAGGLAAITPAGKRAISIRVDNISSLIGMINPGDYVDISYVGAVPIQTPDGKTATQMASIPLFQNVLVLAVGQEIGAGPSEGGSRYQQKETKQENPLITVALAPQEASMISFLQEQGSLRLILRSPADAKVEPIPPASWETVFQYIMPQQAGQGKGGEPAAPVQKAPTVDIYRGLNKETVPLSSR